MYGATNVPYEQWYYQTTLHTTHLISNVNQTMDPIITEEFVGTAINKEC